MKAALSIKPILAWVVLLVATFWAFLFILVFLETAVFRSIPYDYLDYIVNIQTRQYDWTEPARHGRTFYIARYFLFTAMFLSVGALSLRYLRKRGEV